VLDAERIDEIGLGDQVREAVRRKEHFHRARLSTLVEVDEALVEALDGDPVLALEREEALGLDLVELRQAIELLLVERESVLDRDEPRGDITDALRQRPQAAVDGVELGRELPLALLRPGELGLDLLEPRVDGVLAAVVVTARGRGERSQEDDDEEKEQPAGGHQKEIFAG